MTTSPIDTTYTDSAKQYLQYLFSSVLDVDALVSDWAFGRIQDDALTPDEVMRELRYGTDSSPAGQAAHASYIKRYPQMKELLKAGKLPWAPGSSPEQVYQEYENTVKSLLKRYGASAAFSTRDNISNYLMNDVSAAEVSDRLQLASDAVHNMPNQVRSLFKSFYGIDEQDLTSFYLNPAEQAPILQRKSEAVRLAGEGLARGVQIQASKAEWLAMNNVSPEQARQSFAAVSARFGLEYGGAGGAVGRDTMVDAAFGDESAARKVQQAESGRKAAFQGGSGTTPTSKGTGGLGSATY
jgi:predicted DNA-binding protein YlxM (UPF0122 family)